jgi:hypothetical protein
LIGRKKEKNNLHIMYEIVGDLLYPLPYLPFPGKKQIYISAKIKSTI